MSTAPRYDHWAAALDELELTVTVAERLLEGEASDEELPIWNPPQGLGPIPPVHVRRAQRLLARQRELISRAATAKVGVRQKLELLDRLTGAGQGARPRTPLYVDLTA